MKLKSISVSSLQALLARITHPLGCLGDWDLAACSQKGPGNAEHGDHGASAELSGHVYCTEAWLFI